MSTHQIPINFIPIENLKKIYIYIYIEIHLTRPKTTYKAKFLKSSTLSKLDKLKQPNNSKIP